MASSHCRPMTREQLDPCLIRVNDLYALRSSATMVSRNRSMRVMKMGRSQKQLDAEIKVPWDPGSTHASRKKTRTDGGRTDLIRRGDRLILTICAKNNTGHRST